MSWSHAEIIALAQKAARGAGAPPGQAARFGDVAAIHLGAARPSVDLADALDDLPQGAILDYPLALDRAVAQYLAEPRGNSTPLSDSALMESYVETLPFEAQLASGMLLIVDAKRPRGRRKTGRINGCDPLVEKMLDLAARTYVPESDASRQSGAGAGLLDND